MIIFFDNNKNELDRFYGYYPPKEFMIKLKNVVNGTNTFPSLLTKYNLGDQRYEIKLCWINITDLFAAKYVKMKIILIPLFLS